MSETSVLVMDATFASTDEEYADVRALREILTAVWVTNNEQRWVTFRPYGS